MKVKYTTLDNKWLKTWWR